MEIHFVQSVGNDSNYDQHFCKALLYFQLPDTSVRLWDFLIFVPNVCFLAYLLWGIRTNRERIKQLDNFPILRNFYIFLYLCTSVSILRCFVSVVMKVHTTGGDITDKIFWVVVRFFLLSTEISVLVFGLFSSAGHLDVRQSIRRILGVTLLLALVYSVCQGTFEIIAPDASFYVVSKDYHLFGHGGMTFWFFTSIFSALFYLNVVLLPWSPCRHRLLLPTKQSFYAYAGILSFLNIVQAIGAALFFFNNIWGLCIVDATTYMYFTLFTPLVYFIYLSPFFAVSSTSGGAALVTTTAGTQSFHSRCDQQSAPLTSRPSNLFTSGIRGAVNFSYRPHVDDDLLDNEDELASSINSGFGGGLHFDNNNFQQNTSRHPVFAQNNIPRNISSFSIVSIQPIPTQQSTINDNFPNTHTSDMIPERAPLRNGPENLDLTENSETLLLEARKDHSSQL